MQSVDIDYTTPSGSYGKINIPIPEEPSVTLQDICRVNTVEQWIVKVKRAFPSRLQKWIDVNGNNRALLYQRPHNRRIFTAWEREFTEALHILLTHIPIPIINEYRDGGIDFQDPPILDMFTLMTATIEFIGSVREYTQRTVKPPARTVPIKVEDTLLAVPADRNASIGGRRRKSSHVPTAHRVKTEYSPLANVNEAARENRNEPPSGLVERPVLAGVASIKVGPASPDAVKVKVEPTSPNERKVLGQRRANRR